MRTFSVSRISQALILILFLAESCFSAAVFNGTAAMDNCPICIEVLSNVSCITTLPCHHDFHKECIKRWCLKSNACPYCRTVIDFRDMISIGLEISDDILTSTIRKALNENDLESMRVIIKLKGAESLNSLVIDDKGTNALLLAAEIGNLEMIKLLLTVDKGMNVNAIDYEGHTAMFRACAEKHKDVVMFLLSQQNIQFDAVTDFGRSPLMIASREGATDIVRILLEAGAFVNRKDKRGMTALTLASYNGFSDTVYVLLEQNGIKVNDLDGRGESSLMKAVQNGHLEVVLLLSEHPQVNLNLINNDKETALHLAAKYNHVDIVRFLSTRRNIEIDAINGLGHSALMVAAEKGHALIVQALLDTNASINLNHESTSVRSHLEPQKHSALIIACRKDNNEVLKILVADPNIDINIQDWAGKTAFHWAIIERKRDIIKSLLRSSHIDFGIKDKEGFTAFDYYCRQLMDPSITDLLLSDSRISLEKLFPPLHFPIKANLAIHSFTSPFANYKNFTFKATDCDGKYVILIDEGSGPVKSSFYPGIDVNSKIFDNGSKSLIHQYDLLTTEMYIHIMSLDGIDVNVGEEKLLVNETALFKFTKNNNIKLIRELLKFDNLDVNVPVSSPNCYGDFCTALHLAVKMRNVEIAKLLLDDKRIDATALDSGGRTILHIAFRDSPMKLIKMDLIKLIVDHPSAEANLRTKNKEGLTPLQVLSENRWFVKDERIEIQSMMEKFNLSIPLLLV